MTTCHTNDRRRLALVAAPAAVLLLAGLVTATAAPAQAADPVRCTQLSDTGLASGEADFDGDGIGDVAYGLPTHNAGGVGGSVIVRTKSATTKLSLTSTGTGTSSAGDGFGTVVRAEYIDTDACTDLVISAPGAYSASGRVYVVFGANAGIGKGRPTLVISAPQVHAGDRFGAALDTSNTNSGYYSPTTLAIGAPGTKVARATNAGAVHQFELDGYDDGGVALRRTWTWTQGAKGVGAAEKDDHFGEVIEMGADVYTVIVGVPGEDRGRSKNTGAVDIRTTSGKIVELSQKTRGVAGNPSAGDRFGASVIQDRSTLAVGVPGEKVGKTRRAGLVQLFTQRTKPYPVGEVYTASRALTLNTANVTGSPRKNDRLGSNVAILRGYARTGALTIAAGLPNRKVGKVTQAGAVAVFQLTAKACKRKARVCGGLLTQSRKGVPGSPVKSGHFGASVALLGDFYATETSDRLDTLVVGSPGATVGSTKHAGSYTVWGPNGDFAVSDPSGLHPGEGFGAAPPARYTGFSLYR